MNTESILDVNGFTKLLDGHCVHLKKLLKLSKYANAETLDQVRRLAEHIDELDCPNEIGDAEKLGEYLTTCDPDYGVAEEIHPFLDHAGFGEQFFKEHKGGFVDGGCMYILDGDKTLEEILAQSTAPEQRMQPWIGTSRTGKHRRTDRQSRLRSRIERKRSRSDSCAAKGLWRE